MLTPFEGRVDAPRLERDRLARDDRRFAGPDHDVGERIRSGSTRRRTGRRRPVARVPSDGRFTSRRLDVTRAADEGRRGATAVEHDRLDRTLVERAGRRARSRSRRCCRPSHRPSTVARTSVPSARRAIGRSWMRLRRERRDGPDALLSLLDQPFAAADRLDDILPAGGDRGRDGHGRSDDELRQDRGVGALGGQDERAGRDRRVAAGRQDRTRPTPSTCRRREVAGPPR